MNRFKNLIANFATYEGDGAGGGGGGESDEDKLLRIVNAAVTSQLGRKLGPAISDAVGTAIGTALEPIQASLTALAAQPPGDKGKGKGKEQDSELANEVAALRNQIKEKDEDAKLSAETQRGRVKLSKIREGLVQAGVRKELLDGAVATLTARFNIADDGQTVTYRADRNGYHEDLTVEAGLKEWSGTDQGKAHLSPTGAGGAGSSTPGAGGLRPGQLPTDPKARAAAVKSQRVAQARQDLRQGVEQLMGGGRMALSGSTVEGGE